MPKEHPMEETEDTTHTLPTATDTPTEPATTHPQPQTRAATTVVDGLNIPVDPAAYVASAEHAATDPTQRMPPAPAPAAPAGAEYANPAAHAGTANATDTGLASAPAQPNPRMKALKLVGLVAALAAMFAIGYVLGTQRVINESPAQATTNADTASTANKNTEQDSATADSDSSDDATPDKAEATKSDTAPADKAEAFDVSTLIGQKWSNAKKVMKANDIDTSDITILTDDGKNVFVDSNWSVDDAYRDQSGDITVKLKHDTDTAAEAGNKANDFLDGAGNALNNLLNGNGQ